jgi:hypothetical protein
MTMPPPRRELLLSRAHTWRAVVAIVLMYVLSSAPFLSRYLLAPPGLHFTGAAVYAEDAAQHEAWATEMASHLRYQNLLTPEPTPRGWLIHPLDLFLGLLMRATGLPYMLLAKLFALALVPVLALGLLTLARRAGTPSPGIVAVIALLAGSFAPIAIGAARLGLVHGNLALVRSVGGDATPMFTGAGLYLMLAVFVLIALPTGDAVDPTRGFRRAGVVLFALGTIYPFFVPVLWLTACFCALLWVKRWGWRAMLQALGWLGLISVLPMLYWAVLPMLDSEFARFAAANWRPLFSPRLVFVSLGLGLGAVLGIPRLWRGNAYQQMLGCFTVAFIVALYIPQHPWRQHLFYLSPVLVVTAISAWWPVLMQMRPRVRWAFAGPLLLAAFVSTPYYYARGLQGLVELGPPAYLTSGDIAAINWIRDQPGTDVVLATSDVSPWVAARGGHRVVVGHYLWTHDYRRRRSEVNAVFQEGADPRPLLRAERVMWILLDGSRDVPEWALGVEPVARFENTLVLPADRVLQHLDRQKPSFGLH